MAVITAPGALHDPAPLLEPRPVLEAVGIVHRWRRASAPLLDRLDLDLMPGEALHLTGPNGAGKTTLLRILAGLILPAGGQIRLRGLDPQLERRAFQRRLGVLAAGDRGLHPRLSPRRHLDYWARLCMLPRAQRPAAVDRALGAFALEPLADRRVDRLSMGQRQRVRLAMTFLHEPDVVLLDEPRTSLDGEGVALLAHAVEELLARGGGAVWCAPVGEPQGVRLSRTVRLAEGRLA